MNEEQRRWFGKRALRKLDEQGLIDDDFLFEALERAQGRLSGSPGRTPTPLEVEQLLEEANGIARRAAGMGGLPLCGAEPPGEVVGEVVICKLATGHTDRIKHRDPDVGYSWWGEK